jgi:hypothetical protein
MKDDKHKRAGQTGAPAKNPEKDPLRDSDKHSSKDSRKDRLKLALRENLKRRKSQARGRDGFTTASSASDDIASHEGSEENPGK